METLPYRSLTSTWKLGNKLAVLGAQWGDEGKGKIVDALSEEANLVVRVSGGANAGHTLDVRGLKTVTHLLPSGIVRKGMLNLIGPGVLCDLDVAHTEITAIADPCGANVLLDRSAPVVSLIHRWFDAAREASGNAIGTTKRGIGPACEDLASRRGSVRLGDLTDVDRVRRVLTDGNYYAERRAAARAYRPDGEVPDSFPSLEAVIDDLMRHAGTVIPRLCDGRAVAWDADRANRKILFEGAQGVLLDVYAGSAPHTTSSLCTKAGIAATFGIDRLGAVIGVTKAYATRVGEGPFPTEMTGDLAHQLREAGHEYGSTTGRPRRCGWLDLMALRYAVRMGGITHLAVTKLDTLAIFDELTVGMSYAFKGAPLGPHETLTSKVQREAVVDYARQPGWKGTRLSQHRRIEDLPEAARSYLRLIEAATGCPLVAVGVGPERDELAL